VEKNKSVNMIVGAITFTVLLSVMGVFGKCEFTLF